MSNKKNKTSNNGNILNARFNTAQGKKMHQLSLSLDSSFDKLFKKFEKKAVSTDDILFWQEKFDSSIKHIYELMKEMNEEANINVALPSLK